jgi:hypothetical protein
VVDIDDAVREKREYYLQIMQKAQQLNDHHLIRLIIKKMSCLGLNAAVSKTSGCSIITFPSRPYQAEPKDYERPSMWLLLRLALAIPGSLIALLLLAYYRMDPSIYWVWPLISRP